jgi:hypothetical protein
MIIGMEWLERYSPMHIHWAQKWISIPYQGKHITIQGNGSYMTECHMVELMQMTADLEGSNSAEPLRLCCSSFRQPLRLHLNYHQGGFVTI